MRDDDRERADAFSGPGCGWTRLDALNCLIFWVPSAFARESCIKGAIHVRGGVLKSTLVVDSDRHTNTVAFSPSVPQS